MILRRATQVRVFAEPDGSGSGGTETAVITINPDGQDPQLEVDFSCTMTITPDANNATVRIMNLSRATRDRIAGVTKRNLDVTKEIAGQPALYSALGGNPVVKVTTVKRGDVYVEIDGGYLPKPVRMFEGSAQWTRHYKTGPTWVTEMLVGDGLSTMMDGVARKSFPPGATLFEVVEYVIKTMGLGMGNVTEEALLAIVGPGQTSFTFGFTTLGESKWLLSSLIKDFNGEWFVDRGQAYIVKKGEPLPDPAVSVSFDQGLMHQPEPLEGGKVRIRSMFRPDIRIGRKVAVLRANFEGTYRAEVVSHRMNNRVGEAVTEVILSTKEASF